MDAAVETHQNGCTARTCFLVISRRAKGTSNTYDASLAPNMEPGGWGSRLQKALHSTGLLEPSQLHLLARLQQVPCFLLFRRHMKTNKL